MEYETLKEKKWSKPEEWGKVWRRESFFLQSSMATTKEIYKDNTCNSIKTHQVDINYTKCVVKYSVFKCT